MNPELSLFIWIYFFLYYFSPRLMPQLSPESNMYQQQIEQTPEHNGYLFNSASKLTHLSHNFLTWAILFFYFLRWFGMKEKQWHLEDIDVFSLKLIQKEKQTFITISSCYLFSVLVKKFIFCKYVFILG